MYTVSDWSICSAPSWISARMRSHYRIGLERTIGVTSVRMRQEDRCSIVVSSSRRPRRVKVLATSFDSSLALCCSFVCALQLFLRPGLRRHRRAARWALGCRLLSLGGLIRWPEDPPSAGRACFGAWGAGDADFTLRVGAAWLERPWPRLR